MSNHIDKIVDRLPEGLTESGIEEVAELLNEVVEERVQEQMKLLEARVKAFLRTKLDELKESAKRQLENDDEFVRHNKVYEAIKTIVAADIDGEDVNRAVRVYEEDAVKLQTEIEVLTSKLDQAVNENTLLSSKSKKQQKKLHRLSEALEGEREKVDAPFKSSESAIMITNESHGDQGLPTEAAENFFLNEDVIKLSQLQYKEN